jgi:DNA-binding transcriptional ArsR family regulator
MVVDLAERERADRLFQALADATRRDIVAIVLHDEQRVSDLARRYPMSFAAIQKHVAVLERAGLVTKERRGREQLVRGNIDTIRRAHRLLDRLEVVWRERIDRFGAVLAQPQGGAPR